MNGLEERTNFARSELLRMNYNREGVYTPHKINNELIKYNSEESILRWAERLHALHEVCKEFGATKYRHILECDGIFHIHAIDEWIQLNKIYLMYLHDEQIYQLKKYMIIK